MPLLEFRCENNHTTERFYFNTEKWDDVILCPQCNRTASRIQSVCAPILGAGGIPRSTFHGSLCNEGGDEKT